MSPKDQKAYDDTRVNIPLRRAKVNLHRAKNRASKAGYAPPDISVEELSGIYARHEDVCAFPGCCTPLRARMDHCHVTGKFRGFLCNHHNMLEGQIGKRKGEDHEAAARFLMEWNNNNGPKIMDYKSEENDSMRGRSDCVQYESKLVSFLYELMRDHVTPGVIEKVLRNSSIDKTTYTNGWLAKYAADMAERLTSLQLPVTDKEGK